MPDHPNVVLFITHDTGKFVSPYGIQTVETPASERLAREGVMFRNSFCTTPLCAPSRAACVTGRYPHQNGVNGLTATPTGEFDFHPRERHAASIFSEAGYSTVLCGFEHETPNWKDHGFDRALSGDGGHFNGGGDLRDHPVEINRWLNERRVDSPFYMQIGCHETHQKWKNEHTPPFDQKGVVIPSYLRDLPELREEMSEFQGSVNHLDTQLGRILEVFDSHQLTENTVFVFTTDHGIDFPRAKGTMYDSGLEAFLFIRFPGGGWPGGVVHDEMISNVDILPTLLDICGLQRPRNLMGFSFRNVVERGDAGPRTELFAEKTFHDTYDPTRCIRTERYKYIRHFEVNIFQDLRLATETRRHYFGVDWRRRQSEELYDLHNDPGERHNLLHNSHYEQVLTQLRRRLVDWMNETEDPLLNGPMQSPRYRRELEELKQYGST